MTTKSRRTAPVTPDEVARARNARCARCAGALDPYEDTAPPRYCGWCDEALSVAARRVVEAFREGDPVYREAPTKALMTLEQLLELRKPTTTTTKGNDSP